MSRVPRWLKLAAQTARLMVGVHDYDSYVVHCREHHPDLEPMSREQFFRACLDARYPGKNGKINRCPC